MSQNLSSAAVVIGAIRVKAQLDKAVLVIITSLPGKLRASIIFEKYFPYDDSDRVISLVRVFAVPLNG